MFLISIIHAVVPVLLRSFFPGQEIMKETEEAEGAGLGNSEEVQYPG